MITALRQAQVSIFQLRGRKSLLTVKLLAFVLAAAALQAQTLTVLHRFHRHGDGGFPYDSVLRTAGQFYGTTSEGGSFGYGTVFVSYTASGAQMGGGRRAAWSEIRLATFTGPPVVGPFSSSALQENSLCSTPSPAGRMEDNRKADFFATTPGTCMAQPPAAAISTASLASDAEWYLKSPRTARKRCSTLSPAARTAFSLVEI